MVYHNDVCEVTNDNPDFVALAQALVCVICVVHFLLT